MVCLSLRGTLPPREPASEVRLAGLPDSKLWAAQSRNVSLAPATARPPAAGAPAGHAATSTRSPRNRWPVGVGAAETSQG